MYAYDLMNTALVIAGEGATTPAWISSIDFSSVTDTVTALAGVIVPVIVAVLAVTIGIKKLKSMANKI